MRYMTDEKGNLDKYEMRALYPTDREMKTLRLLGTGKGDDVSPDLLDFLEMVWQEMKKEIEAHGETGAWIDMSPVVRAYLRYDAGERPE